LPGQKLTTHASSLGSDLPSLKRMRSWTISAVDVSTFVRVKQGRFLRLSEDESSTHEPSSAWRPRWAPSAEVLVLSRDPRRARWRFAQAIGR